MLRLTHSRLPSLSALPADLTLPSQSTATGDGCAEAPDWRPAEERPQGEELWLFGDSMVAGRRLDQQDRLAQILARRGSEHLGTKLGPVDRSHPGSDLCGSLRNALTEVAIRRPAAAVFGVFQDDLIHHTLVRTDGGYAMAPTSSSPLARSLIEGSYALNFLWFRWRVQTQPPTVHLTTPAALEALRRTLTETVQAFAGVPTVWVLLDPVGRHRCPVPGEEDHCDDIAYMSDLLADELRAANIDLLDFRGRWEDPDSLVIDIETDMPVPTHPNATGTLQLADAVWAALELEPQLEGSP